MSRTIEPGVLAREEPPTRTVAALESVDPDFEASARLQLGPMPAPSGAFIRLGGADSLPRPDWLEPPAGDGRRIFARLPKTLLQLRGGYYLGQGVVSDAQLRLNSLSCPRYGKPNAGGPLSIDAERRVVLGAALRVDDAIDEPVVVLGDIPDHFGHFLLEVVPKLWIAGWAAGQGLKVLGFRKGPLRDWQAALIEAGGVALDRLVFLERPARLERAIMPGSLYRLHRAVHPDLAAVAQRISAAFPPPADPRRRLFLGRKFWPKNRRLTNEDEVARLFEGHGFAALYPETLPIAEQIAAVGAADVLAGPLGSQLYLGLFQQGARAAVVLAPEGFVLPDSALLADLNGAPCCFFLCQVHAEAGLPPKAWDLTADLSALDRCLDRWLGLADEDGAASG